MASDIFIKIGDIEGESQDETYKDWIDVLSWSWGATQSGSAHYGMGGGDGKVAVQDFNFVKRVDRASTNLFVKCCEGSHFPKVNVVMRKAGGDSPVEYLKFEMERVLVSSISTGSSTGEDGVTEQIGLNFETLKMEYTPQSEDGSAEASMDAGWDIPKNKKM